MIDWDIYPNFSEAEFACACCGRADMDTQFMDTLQTLRTIMRFPFVISSGYRCPQRNQQVSPATGPTGPHTTGLAADILVSGKDAHKLLRVAVGMFSGVGVSQKGDHADRFIHLDQLPEGPTRPWVWSY